MIHTATAHDAIAGLRLDDGLKSLFPAISKTEIRRVIDWGGCTVNDQCIRVASRQLQFGDRISLGVMEKERCVELIYEQKDLIYEDSDYLAVNKASGFNSQRTPYQLKGTVEYAVSVYLKQSRITEPARVVHRLDRGTSGVMFFPKTKKAATHISYQLKNAGVEKIYWAVISGVPDLENWDVDAPVAKLNKFRYGVALPGKNAFTSFRLLCQGTSGALIEARPRTGRTHQIRVHLEHGGMPILGDTPYGGTPADRLMLHCRSMSFATRDNRKVSATAPVDEGFTEICTKLGIELPHDL